jgi:hypothetical protein
MKVSNQEFVEFENLPKKVDQISLENQIAMLH